MDKWKMNKLDEIRLRHKMCVWGGVRLDDWVTMNGTHVLVDKAGNITGSSSSAKKIKSTSKKASTKKSTAASGGGSSGSESGSGESPKKKKRKYKYLEHVGYYADAVNATTHAEYNAPYTLGGKHVSYLRTKRDNGTSTLDSVWSVEKNITKEQVGKALIEELEASGAQIEYTNDSNTEIKATYGKVWRGSMNKVNTSFTFWVSDTSYEEVDPHSVGVRQSGYDTEMKKVSKGNKNLIKIGKANKCEQVYGL